MGKRERQVTFPVIRWRKRAALLADRSIGGNLIDILMGIGSVCWKNVSMMHNVTTNLNHKRVTQGDGKVTISEQKESHIVGLVIAIKNDRNRKTYDNHVYWS